MHKAIVAAVGSHDRPRLILNPADDGVEDLLFCSIDENPIFTSRPVGLVCNATAVLGIFWALTWEVWNWKSGGRDDDDEETAEVEKSQCERGHFEPLRVTVG